MSVNVLECHEDSAEVARDILKLFDEYNLTQNQGWLVLLDLFASTAVASGLTLAQTQERVGKAFKLYMAAYEARQAGRS